jgi:ATP-binding cassette subfamily B protein
MASANNAMSLKTKKEKAPKPKYNMFQNAWFMVKLAWTAKEKKVIILSLLAAGLAVANNLVNLYVSPTILSVLERKGSVSELLWTIIAFTAGIMFVSAASSYVNENKLYGRISVRTEIIKLLNHKAATTSYPNLDHDKFKKLLAESNEAAGSNSQATEAVWETLTTLITNLIGFLIYVNMLTAVQPVLILVVLVTTTAGYFLGNYLKGYEYRHRDEKSEYVKQMEYLSGQAKDWSAAKDIRIFDLRSWIDDLYNKAMGAFMAFRQRAEGVYLWAKIIDVIFAFLRSGIAYAYLTIQVISGGISAAGFLLYFTAISGFTTWVTGILSGFSTLYKQSLDISIVRECLEYPEIFRFEDGEPLKAMKKDYEIKLENVSFRYPGAQKDTLTNINLTLHPGEKLAVVGLNGAGKTTLVKLICGYLDPTQGKVLLDGRDIRDFNRRDYYEMFSAVFQNFSLLAGTVAVNVAQSETDINLDRVKGCVEKASLRQKIESLPDGYETHLNRQVYEDATMLSGGEIQRLMLARALYKDAPFIILDEPTAALDPISESEMYQKYNEMTSGKSSVYISHRLASTRFCDRIIMIDKAGICEEGTHDELLRLGGKYAGLYEVQSKYYQEGARENEE